MYNRENVSIEEIRGIYHEVLQMISFMDSPEKFVVGVLTALRYRLPVDFFIVSRIFSIPYRESGMHIKPSVSNAYLLLEFTRQFKSVVNDLRKKVLLLASRFSNFEIGEYERVLSAITLMRSNIEIVDESGDELDIVSKSTVLAYVFTVARALGYKINRENYYRFMDLFDYPSIPEFEFKMISKTAFYVAYRQSFDEKKLTKALEVKKELLTLREKLPDYLKDILEDIWREGKKELQQKKVELVVSE